MRIIQEKMRTAVQDRDIPHFLWDELFLAVVHVTNRTSTSIHGLTPYEALLNEIYPECDNKPNLRHLRVLGCKVYVFIEKERRVQSHKLDARAEVGILVGYTGTTIYNVYIPSRNGAKVIKSSQVRFDEGGLITEPDTVTDEVTLEFQRSLRPGGTHFNSDTEAANAEAKAQAEAELSKFPEQIPRLADDAADDEQFFDVEEIGEYDPMDDEIVSPPPITPSTSPQQPQPLPTVNKEIEPDIEPEIEIPQPKKRGRPPKGTATAKDKVFSETSTPRVTRSSARQKSQSQPPDFQEGLHPIMDCEEGTSEYQGAFYAGADRENATGDPTTILEALTCADASRWKLSILKECNSLARKKTWTLKKRMTAVKDGERILKGRYVFRTKRDGSKKVRWVVKGYEQKYGRDYDQTYAGVCKTAAWKIVVALAAKLDYKIEQMDVDTAFLNSEIDGRVLCECPPYWFGDFSEIHAKYNNTKEWQWICILLKALYGLKQSPRLWQKRLKKVLKKLGFEPLAADNCVYINTETGIIIVTYVDDMLLVGKDLAAIDLVKAQLHEEFGIQDLGPARNFLGVEITRDRPNRKIYLCQKQYIQKILERFGAVDCKPHKTPFASGAMEFMVPYNGKATASQIEQYQQLIGSFMYLTTQVHAEIAYATSILSQFLVNPSPAHFAAARRMLGYIKSVQDLCIVLGGKGSEITADEEVHAYCDSDWAGDKTTRKSHSGYTVFFMGGLVSHMSKKQPIVTGSSTEAEYVGMGSAVQELVWIRRLLLELGYRRKDAQTVKLYVDNQGAQALAENPQFHQRTKHIDVRYHWIREQVEHQIVDLYYVPTAEMAADGLTKSLAITKHSQFIEMLGMRYLPAKLARQN